jgi:hypothetical protein
MSYIINNDTMENIRSLSIYDDIQAFRGGLTNLLQENNYRFDPQLINNVGEYTILDIMNITNINDDDYNSNYEGYFNTINNILMRELFVEPENNDNDNDAMDIIEEEQELQQEDPNQIPEMAIPTREPHTIESLQEELQQGCSICYRELDLINLTITRCRHVFHSSCLNTAAEYSPLCPTCRTQLIIPTLD